MGKLPLAKAVSAFRKGSVIRAYMRVLRFMFVLSNIDCGFLRIIPPCFAAKHNPVPNSASGSAGDSPITLREGSMMNALGAAGGRYSVGCRL